MRFGAHVPVAGGYDKTIAYAREIGCECMQVFAKSPRQWVGTPMDPERAVSFVVARRDSELGPLFTHTAYLINVATSDAALRERSIAALADELVRAAMLGAEGVVTHVGNDPDSDAEAAAMRVGSAVREALSLAEDAGVRVRLLLENSAGAGRSFGCSFEELGACIAAADLAADRLGVCFDTCHAFAYGMPLESDEGWDWVLSRLDRAVGLERLGLVHANDCLYERGSRRDRHAWVGDGFIGREGFSAMVCRPELADTCACIEVAGEMPYKDIENLGRLKALRRECAPSQSTL